MTASVTRTIVLTSSCPYASMPLQSKCTDCVPVALLSYQEYPHSKEKSLQWCLAAAAAAAAAAAEVTDTPDALMLHHSASTGMRFYRMSCIELCRMCSLRWPSGRHIHNVHLLDRMSQPSEVMRSVPLFVSAVHASASKSETPCILMPSKSLSFNVLQGKSFRKSSWSVWRCEALCYQSIILTLKYLDCWLYTSRSRADSLLLLICVQAPAGAHGRHISILRTAVAGFDHPIESGYSERLCLKNASHQSHDILGLVWWIAYNQFDLGGISVVCTCAWCLMCPSS